jgi:hypothetical protein
MADEDDALGDDPMEDEAFEAYERHRDAVQEMVADYFEDFDIDPALGAQLLLEAMIGFRVSAYGIGVENPSVAGLKLDLDRLAREVADLVREMKKNAEECIEEIKRARAEAEAEEDDEDEDDDEGGDDEGNRNPK